MTLAVRGTPANKAALERHFGPFLAKSLQSCTVCHLPSDKKDPDTLEDFPHNPFGDAVRKAGTQLRREGKKREMAARIAIVAAMDSDGDGVDNLTELLLGHNPGDPKDVPSREELSQAGAKREAFVAFCKEYRWEPFEVVKRPAVPSEPGPTWAKNPIDAFVLERQRAHGLTPSPEAPRDVLLRRVYLDLIGLNPTPEEIAAFEKDASPDAYEKVVDRLLADPRYGQRWARHWMDVWRYSDWAGWTGGNQIRDSQPFIWRWRDWIVESLNADKGYDRMVLEMLAADELCPQDQAALRATGFLVRNYKMLSREQWLEDTVNHTSRAFLGLTMHCAKCHDHKFDPVTQEEYYRLRAIFEPHNVRIDPVPGTADKKTDGLARAYDKEIGAETWFYTRGDERTPDKKRGAMVPGVPACLGGELKIQPVRLPAESAHPDRQAFVKHDLLAESQRALDEARKKYQPIKDDDKQTARARSEAEAAIALAKAKHAAMVAVLKSEELADAGKKGSDPWKAAARDTVAAQRAVAVAQATSDLLAAQSAIDAARQKGDKGAKDLKTAQDKLDKAQRALAAAGNDLSEPLGTNFKPRSTDDYPDTSTGRRLAFARWLVDADNPLAARVAVNHIWARHFAQGLVPSVDDFGRNGRPATHPALVDWLASELMANGWHTKPIHRLIVTSATYRQSSLPRDKDLAADPDDTWLWRFESKRMEAELVRDNVLWAGGQLDLTAGGPEIAYTQGLASKRRSLYLQEAPEKEVAFLKIFDGPNPNECYFRRPSVMPHQALALGNSALVFDEAKAVAAKLKGAPDPGAFIEAAYLRVLARRPTTDERAACEAFLARTDVAAERKREDFIVVLFNHNDFVAIR
ncbi:MAG TPA: DUF1549 and DUF1553 domain-containing protein [Tepidisphaeraceae bacterium]